MIHADEHHIAFMFRTPIKGMMSDTLIAKMTGAKYVHVDTVFVPPVPRALLEQQEREETMKQMFSTYVGESFKGYTPVHWTQRNNDTHHMLLLSVSEEEYNRARAYVCDLCHSNVTYNYVDLVLCSVPNAIAKGITCDIGPYPIPKTAYCSQAVILILRHAIAPGRIAAPMVQMLDSTNSRACSPMMLCNMLGPHCTSIDVARYVINRELVNLAQ
jgi:hypothetical protein